MRKIVNFVSFTVIITVLFSSCGDKKNENVQNTREEMEKQLSDFIRKLEEKIKPLSKQSAESYWIASISGKEEDYAKSAQLSFELNKIFTDKNDFEFLKKMKESNLIEDEILKRQLTLLYNEYLENQIDSALLKEMIDMQTAIEMKFSNFRAEIDGKKYSDNEIEEILKTSTDSKQLEKAWLAHKRVGELVANDVITLVKKRNEVARKLGFENYHTMSLILNEQNPTDIEKLFDELDSLTKNDFAKLKDEMDEYYAKRYKISKDKLMPWHYQNRFFQEGPKIYEVDFDKYYKDKDIVKVTTNYFASIGLPIDDIVARSDLFEKPGKNQHAYCIDIDHEGDIRILCNIKPNQMWMNTMLHEFGHGLYNKYISRELPFILRNPAHTFTTEAVAMLFGRFATNAKWMKDNLGITDLEAKKIADLGYKQLRLEQLVFSRWAQVMYRFEKALYSNPDTNLNQLWWELVEKYQLLRKPEGRNAPDWASKIHIATVPCYYHNYLLGELLASQLYFYIVKNVIKSDDLVNQSFSNNKEVGKYLIEKVFSPGALYYWNDMIEKATGEKLTPKYYARQFVQSRV